MPDDETIFLEKINKLENENDALKNEVHELKSILEQYRSDGDLYLQNIIESIPEYIFWKDANFFYQGCNKKVSDYLGLTSPDDIIGKSDYDFNWSDERIHALHAIDQQVVTSGVSNVVEDIIPDDRGGERVMLTSKSPMHDNEGRTIGIIGVSTDITKLKKYERDLVTAKKKADVANEAKSVFIANMSHDIRTPITGILCLAQALADNAENENNKKDATMLISVTNELLSLLNQIIEVISLKEGHYHSDDDEFSLNDIAKHNMTLLAAAANNKNIKLETTIDKDVPAVLIGNKIYLDRILLNVLGNAVKFTDKGYVKLHISMVQKQDQAYTRFVIEDTGIGIPPDKYETIFENFSRLNPSYDGIYKGKGLGLYTVKQYLTSMRGEITVESIPMQGSTFTVDIPLKPSERKAIDPSTEIDSVASVDVPDTDVAEVANEAKFDIPDPIASVLIVEDSKLAARMVGQILHQCLCETDLAENGAEAIEKSQQNSYDLILMDIGLPDMDGLEVARQIRQYKKTEDIPIVGLTGHLGDEKKASCINAGMQEMISKPATVLQVQTVLQRYVFSNANYIEKNGSTASLEYHDLPTIDIKEAATLAGGNINFAKEMLEELVDRLPVELNKLKQLYKNKGMDEMYDLVHKLYGGLCYCGVPKLCQLTKELKESLLRKDYAKVDNQLTKVIAEASKVIMKVKDV